MASKLIFGKMIDYLRLQKGMSMEEFGKLVGKNKSTISRWVNESRFPTIEEAEEIACQFNIPLNVLLFGAKNADNLFEKYANLQEQRQDKVIEFVDYQLEEQSKAVDLNDYIEETMYGYLSAGTGEFLDTDIKEKVQIPKSILPDQHYDLILQVNGDSMEPMFEDNEYIFIRRTEEIRSGQIGALIINGESYLKKVYINDDHIRLVSLNTKYEDQMFNGLDDIKVIGTVVM